MESPVSDHFVVIIEHVPPYDEHTHSWILKVSLGDSLATAELKDPFTDDDEEDLRWALEDYPLSQPFENARAINVRQKLARYAQNVFDQLRESISGVLPSGTTNSPMTLLISASADAGSLHRIHWESLEYLHDTKIFIRRKIEGLQRHIPPPSALTRRKKTRLLLFTARSVTDNDEDVSYTLVSRAVFRIISSLPDSAQTTLHLVRPGTFDALKKALEDESDTDTETIVHFDCHGTVSSNIAYLCFMSKNDSSRTTRVDSRKIGKLLAQHRVSMVIMNACNSAQAGHGVTADLAASLLQQGIPYVVGMRKKLLTSSAAPLLQQLYKNHFVLKMDPFSAIYQTRRRLHAIRTRAAVLSVEVELDDYLIPVLYEQEMQRDVCPLVPSTANVMTEAKQEKPKLDPRTTMIGRDWDLLRVETALCLQSNIIELTAILGCGKTHFLRHASQWWKDTNFVELVLWHDRPGKLTPLSVAQGILAQASVEADSHRIAQALENPISEAIKLVNGRRCLLVIDQADEKISSMNQQEKKELVEFLQQIDKTVVVISLGKWKGTTLDFPPIELSNLSDNATHELALATAKSRRTFQLNTFSDRAYFQQCIAITGNLPLLALMVGNWLGSQLDATPESIFTDLVRGGSFDALPTHPVARRLLDYLKARLTSMGTREERILLLALAASIGRLRKSTIDLRDRLVLLGVLSDDPDDFASPFGNDQLGLLVRVMFPEVSTELLLRSGDYRKWHNLIAVLCGDGLLSDYSDAYWAVHPLLPFALRHLLHLPEFKDLIGAKAAHEAAIGQYRAMSEAWIAEDPLRSSGGLGSETQYHTDKAAKVLQEDFLNCYAAIKLCVDRGPRTWHEIMPWRLIQFAGEVVPIPPPGFNHMNRIVLMDLMKEYLTQYDRTSLMTNLKLSWKHGMELAGKRKTVNGDACTDTRTALACSLSLSRCYYFGTAASQDFPRQLKKTQALFKKFISLFPQDKNDQDVLNMAGQLQLLSVLESLNGDTPNVQSIMATLQAAAQSFSTSSPPDTTGQLGLATARMLSDVFSLLNSSQGAQASPEQAVAALTGQVQRFGDLYDRHRDEGHLPTPSFTTLKGLIGSDPTAFSTVHPSIAAGFTIPALKPGAASKPAFDSMLLSNLAQLQELGDEEGQVTTLVAMAHGALEQENWTDALAHFQTAINLLRETQPALFSTSLRVKDGKELRLASMLNYAAWAAGNAGKTVQCQEYLLMAYSLCSFEANSPTHRVFLMLILTGLLHYGGEPVPGKKAHPLAFQWLVQLAMIYYDRSLVATRMAALFNLNQPDPEVGVGKEACGAMLAAERDGTVFERLYLCFLSHVFVSPSREEWEERLLFLINETGASLEEIIQLLKDVGAALKRDVTEISERAKNGENEPLYREAERVLFGKAEDCVGFKLLPEWEGKALRKEWPS